MIMKDEKKNGGRIFPAVFILTGSLMLLGAVLLAGFNLREQRLAEEASRSALERVDSLIGACEQADEGEFIPDYLLNPWMEMPQMDIDGILYIGRISIPELELELPVITETTRSYLKKAPCRYTGSVYLDNMVIGAHNYDRHFGRIGDLGYGDLIEFTDMDGNHFIYEVADIEILQPDQVEDLCSGDWPLSLYTCTPGGRTRVTVRCAKTAE